VSEHWHIFAVNELNAIAFECPTCHTLSTFSASGDPAGKTERQCPGCNRVIPRAGAILHLFRTLHENARSAAEDERVNVTLRAIEKDSKA